MPPLEFHRPDPHAARERTGGGRSQSERPLLRKPIVVVAREGEAHYRTISEALHHVEAGARIVVRPGIYQETLLLDRPVQIVGEGAVETIVVMAVWGPCLTMQCASASVRGLTLRSRVASQREQYPTVSVPMGQLILDGCDIRSGASACVEVFHEGQVVVQDSVLQQTPGAGVIVRDGGEAHLRRSRLISIARTGFLALPGGKLSVDECLVAESRIAAFIHEQTTVELLHCTIEQIRDTGIVIDPGAAPVIRECKLSANQGVGISVRGGGGRIEDCEVIGQQQAGIEILRQSTVEIRRCKVRDCMQPGVVFSAQATGLIEDCDIQGNAVAGVLIEQRSEPTIRNCRISEGNNACGILVRGKSGGVIEQCDIYKNPDPGILLDEGSHPLVHRCKIREGGHHGILISTRSGGKIQSCELYGNQLAGVAVEQGGDPEVVRCKVRDHHHASVFVTEDGKGEFTDCDLGPSKVAGILLERGADPRLVQCRVHTSAQAGVAVLSEGRAQLEDCRIENNGLAGVMVGEGGEAIVRHCRIQDNGREPIRIEDEGRCRIDSKTLLVGNVEDRIDVAPGGLLRDGPSK